MIPELSFRVYWVTYLSIVYHPISLVNHIQNPENVENFENFYRESMVNYRSELGYLLGYTRAGSPHIPCS